MKRRLKPAVAELESTKFLWPMSEEQRYAKRSRGVWQVTFRRAPELRSRVAKKLDADSKHDTDVLVSEMVERGVAERVAVSLTHRHPPDAVRRKLDAFDWLVHRGDTRVSRNPAGFLVASIREDYEPPPGFSPRVGTQVAVGEHHSKPNLPRKVSRPSRVREVWDDRMASYWSTLSEEERTRLDEKALSHAKPFLRKLWEAANGKSQEVAEFYRQTIRGQYLSGTLGRSGPRAR